MRISVVILLAAISIVNASPFLIHKRAVTLGPCTPPSDIVLTGTIDPDPEAGKTAKATTSFTTTADVPKLFLTTTVTDGGDAKTAKVTTADLCASGLKCPIAKGQSVDVTSSTEIPDGIKAPTIEYNFNDGAKVVSCGIGKAAGGAEAPKDGAPKDGAPKDAPPAPGAPPPPPPGGAPPDGGKDPKGKDGPPDGPPAPGGAPDAPDGPKGKDAPADGPDGPPKGQ